MNLLTWGVDLVEEHLMACAGLPARPLSARRPVKHVAEYLVNAQVRWSRYCCRCRCCCYCCGYGVAATASYRISTSAAEIAVVMAQSPTLDFRPPTAPLV